LTTQIDSKLSVMHSEFSRGPGRSFPEGAVYSLDATGAERSVPATAFAEEERGSSAGNSIIATAPEETESTPLEEDSDTSLSVLDLVPASPEFETQQRKSGLALSRSASQSDCAAELVATMGRLLAEASSAPGPPRAFSKAVSESSPALPRTHPGTLIGTAISTALWSGVFAKALLTARETIAAAGRLLRQWKLGFSRDWKLTVNALNFPQMKKSLGHWMHQPFSSKPLASRKNQAV